MKGLYALLGPKWTGTYVPPIGRICQEIELVEGDMAARASTRDQKRLEQRPFSNPPPPEWRAMIEKIGRRIPEAPVTRGPVENSSGMNERDLELRRAELREQARRLGVG